MVALYNLNLYFSYRPRDGEKLLPASEVAALLRMPNCPEELVDELAAYVGTHTFNEIKDWHDQKAKVMQDSGKNNEHAQTTVRKYALDKTYSYVVHVRNHFPAFDKDVNAVVKVLKGKQRESDKKAIESAEEVKVEASDDLKTALGGSQARRMEEVASQKMNPVQANAFVGKAADESDINAEIGQVKNIDEALALLHAVRLSEANGANAPQVESESVSSVAAVQETTTTRSPATIESSTSQGGRGAHGRSGSAKKSSGGSYKKQGKSYHNKVDAPKTSYTTIGGQGDDAMVQAVLRKREAARLGGS